MLRTMKCFVLGCCPSVEPRSNTRTYKVRDTNEIRSSCYKQNNPNKCSEKKLLQNLELYSQNINELTPRQRIYFQGSPAHVAYIFLNKCVIYLGMYLGKIIQAYALALLNIGIEAYGRSRRLEYCDLTLFECQIKTMSFNNKLSWSTLYRT